MSGNAAYEVQGYTGGVWRTLRVCGDAEDAIAEAKRDNRKYLSVRVTAEIYNENSGKYISRTVYRHSQLTPAQKMTLAAPEQKPVVVRPPRRSVPSSRNKVRQPRYGRPVHRAAELVESETITGMLVWRLSLVALIGLSLVWGLQQFRQLL